MSGQPPHHDHDYDGRPPVEHDGYDPLLEALIREHLHLAPAKLLADIRAGTLMPSELLTLVMGDHD